MEFRKDRKTLWVSEDVWKRLFNFKIEKNFKTINDVLIYLLSSKEQGYGSPESSRPTEKNKKRKER